MQDAEHNSIKFDAFFCEHNIQQVHGHIRSVQRFEGEHDEMNGDYCSNSEEQDLDIQVSDFQRRVTFSNHSNDRRQIIHVERVQQ